MTLNKTPDKFKLIVRPGNIIVTSKINDSNLLDQFKRYFNKVQLQDLGEYDFFLPNHKIVYISESKLLTDVDTLKLKSLQTPLIIADRNTVTIEVFSKLQNVLNTSNITLLPVGHSGELPLLLYQISQTQDGHSPAMNLRQPKNNPPDIQQQILLNVPGLGRAKVINLLKKFGTVQKIAFATENELIPIVGANSASKVYKYFNGLIN